MVDLLTFSLSLKTLAVSDHNTGIFQVADPQRPELRY